MSVSDKVITANPVARQTNAVDAFRFDANQQGSNHVISINGVNLFFFANSSDCSAWTNSLNGVVVPVLTSLRSYYDSKVSQILA